MTLTERPTPTRWLLAPSAILVLVALGAGAHFGTRNSEGWAGLADGFVALWQVSGALVIGATLGLALWNRRWIQWGLMATLAITLAVLLQVSLDPLELRSVRPLFLGEAAVASLALIGAALRWRRMPRLATTNRPGTDPAGQRAPSSTTR